MKLKVNSKYMECAIVLFLIEAFIALYVTDAFVRPYVGDFLVVILLYCMVKSIVNSNKTTTIALAVLLFAYVLETLQYFRIVEILGLGDYPLTNVIIGTSFEWIDMLAYTLGIIAVLIVEGRNKR